MVDGADLRLLRERFGLTQATLAERLNVDVGTLSRWERNRTKRSMINSSRIGRVLKSATSRTGSRIVHYAQASISEAFLVGVKHSPYKRSLNFGNTGVTLAVSDVMLKEAPWYAMFIGTASIDLTFGHMRETVSAVAAEAEKRLANGESPVFKYLVNDTFMFKTVNIIAEYTTSFPFAPLHIADTVLLDISRDEYEARRNKAWRVVG
jgi:transcriptional regulator with XRE-family HTH domain